MSLPCREPQPHCTAAEACGSVLTESKEAQRSAQQNNLDQNLQGQQPAQNTKLSQHTHHKPRCRSPSHVSKQGAAVHVPAREFTEKDTCAAQPKKKKRSSSGMSTAHTAEDDTQSDIHVAHSSTTSKRQSQHRHI